MNALNHSGRSNSIQFDPPLHSQRILDTTLEQIDRLSIRRTVWEGCTVRYGRCAPALWLPHLH